MKVSIETDAYLRLWCKLNLPTIHPLDMYLPTYGEFQLHRKAGKVYVFKHGSQNNIFNRRETIWYYRAWHDTIHFHSGNDFSEESEYKVANLMESEARVMGICERDAKLMRLDIELHIMHYHKWKEHPEYQQDLITDYLLLGKKALDKNYGCTL